MIRRPPRSTRTDTLFPYTTLFRSAQHVVADRLFGDLIDEIAGNGERDVRFEQGDAHFAHRGAHVRLGQRATAAQPIENTAKPVAQAIERSEEHTSELQSLMRISYAVF